MSHPTLLDNRISYRFLDVAWGAGGGRLWCQDTPGAVSALDDDPIILCSVA